jgi:nucleoid DNA-binding protein
MNDLDKPIADDASVNGDTLTKRNLVIRIAQETGMNQHDVHTVLHRAFEAITESLCKGQHVEFREFGVFKVVTRKPRIGRNPHKPEDTVRIPARKVVIFKAGRALREAMQKLG